MFQPRYNYGNQWFGAYFGGQHYNGYGYMVPQPHDPRMYAVAPYGGYPVYSDPQQQVSRGNWPEYMQTGKTHSTIGDDQKGKK